MVALSSPQAASGVLRVALRGRKALRRQVDSHRHSFVELEALHRVHAQLHVRAGSGASRVAGDVHQGTMAFVVDCFGSAMAAEDQTMSKRAMVKVDRLRPCAVHLLAQGTADARIQQYVLGVGREIEALTWEGMGNLAVQTCWD